MRDPGAGDGPSSRSKRPRKGSANSADDVARRPESEGAAGDGRAGGKKKSGARPSKKAAGAADVAPTTARRGSSRPAATTSGATATTVTPGDALPHAPAEFKAVAPETLARGEEVPLIVSREEGTLQPLGDDVELRIQRRAYEIYLSRRGAPGDPIADWIAAEREIRSRGR